MLRSVAVKEHMVEKPVTVRPEDSVYDAIHAIIVNRISGVCVVDEHNNLVGILSELDCMRAILSATYNEQAAGKVSESMTTDVVTARLEDDIVNLAADMLAHKQRRRPVVENGKLVGQISCRQILRAVKEFAEPRDPAEWP